LARKVIVKVKELNYEGISRIHDEMKVKLKIVLSKLVDEEQTFKNLCKRLQRKYVNILISQREEKC